MSGVLLNKGQEYILDAVFKNSTIPGNLYIGLMQNSINPEPSENLGSGIIEITGTDYSRILLTRSTDWTRINQVITATSNTFTAGLGGWSSVNGYFVSKELEDFTETAESGTSITIELPSGASSINDFYNERIIKITAGTGTGQTRTITDYVGTTRIATVDSTWGTNPDNTSVFIIYDIAIMAEAFPLLKQGNLASGQSKDVIVSFELKDEGEAIEI
jgi:hypothetical protein